MDILDFRVSAQYVQAELLQLHEMAYEQAMRYRFDPTLGRIHSMYLHEITKIIGTRND